MKIVVNENLQAKLLEVLLEMKEKSIVPLTKYFPFIVCIQWVGEQGVKLPCELNDLRAEVCKQYQGYVVDELDKKDGFSFEQLLQGVGMLFDALDKFIKEQNYVSPKTRD